MNNTIAIKTAVDYAKRYDNNIYSLIKDLNIKVNKIDLENLYGFTVNMNGNSFLYVNCNIDEYSQEYIIAHEIGHILLHDNKLREFNKIANNKNKEELQANLFATIFLGCVYKDCNNDNVIQKIINYIHCNYPICDVMRVI